MTVPVRLTEMLGLAQGEVKSLRDLISLHQRKGTRPQGWIEQHQRILQHRVQVVSLVEAEIGRREKERRAA